MTPPALGALTDLLRGYADGALPRDTLREWLDARLAADPLGVDASECAAWEQSPDETRLFWRLVYAFERDDEEEQAQRRLADRLLRCIAVTGSAADTLELWTVVADQERFCDIARKHAEGVISRTGYLSVLAESGYPPHVKLWLEHASHDALGRFCDWLAAGAYDVAARALEHAPDR